MKKYFISLSVVIVLIALGYYLFSTLNGRKNDPQDNIIISNDILPAYNCSAIGTIRDAVNTLEMQACSCINENLLEECLMNIGDTKKYRSAVEKNDIEICRTIESKDVATICEQRVYENQSMIKSSLSGDEDSFAIVSMIINMHYSEAIPLLEGELEKPDFNKAYLSILANFYAEKALRERKEAEYIPKAINLLERAIVLDPNNVNIYIVYGFVYEVAGEIDKSIEMYNKALEMEPNNIQALLGRAHAKEFLMDNNGAAEDYLAAINLDKKNEHVNANLAFCRLAYSHSAYELAISNCGVVIKNVDSAQIDLVAEAHQIISAIYLEMGDVNKSLISLKEAEALNPNDNNLLLQYAIYYLETNNLAKAQEYATKVAEIDATRAYPHLILGGAFALQNDFKKSITSSYKALELVDEDVSILPASKNAFKSKVYNNLVYSYERDGDVESAKKYAELMN